MTDTTDIAEAAVEWLPVADLEGYYEVSDDGRIRSLDRTVVYSNGGVRNVAGRVLSPHADTSGYPTVAVHRAGVRRYLRIHRAVLVAFRGDRPPTIEGRHLDGDRSNPRLENLVWGSSSDNKQDAIRHGTFLRGSSSPVAILDEEKVRDIRSQHAAGGVSQRELGDRYGVSAAAIHRVISRKRWAHVD